MIQKLFRDCSVVIVNMQYTAKNTWSMSHRGIGAAARRIKSTGARYILNKVALF